MQWKIHHYFPSIPTAALGRWKFHGCRQARDCACSSAKIWHTLWKKVELLPWAIRERELLKQIYPLCFALGASPTVTHSLIMGCKQRWKKKNKISFHCNLHHSCILFSFLRTGRDWWHIPPLRSDQVYPMHPRARTYCDLDDSLCPSQYWQQTRIFFPWWIKFLMKKSGTSKDS